MKKRLLSFISVLVILCMVISAGAALTRAEDPATNDIAGNATLTIIKGVAWDGPAVIVNKTYPFEEDATLADLFEAAKTAGDIEDYAFSYGYIATITPKGASAVSNASDFSYYWANYKNGGYAQGQTDCTDADKLTDGVAFQFSYESYPSNITPDWSTIEPDEQKSTVVAGGGESAGSATLKIVKGVDSWSGAKVLVSKTFDFSKGATLGDLFAAAKEDKAIDDYLFTDSGYGSYISSITGSGAAATANKADFSAYWANYKNGTYASGTDCTEGDELKDGISFEFSWEDYPSMVGLNASEWTDLSAKAEEGTETAKGPEKESESEAESESETETEAEKESETETQTETETPAETSSTIEKEYADGYDASAASNDLEEKQEQTFASLFESLSANTKGASDWYAMCAAAIGNAGVADKDTAIADALAAYASPSGTNLQSSIIILSALGVDVTKVDDGQGGTIDLLDKLANTKSAIGGWAESLAYTLLAYGANPSYGVPADAVNSPSNIIAGLKNSFLCSDGGFGWGGSSSPDTTGAVIAALSCYSDNADARSMMDGAVNALKGLQNADGGFGYAQGAETNVDSTALAIIGLTAAGIDPTGEAWTTDAGSNPLTSILSFANEAGTGLVLPEGTFIEYAESDAFRALVAYSGFRNTGKAYNVYTMASQGNATYKAPEKEEPTTEEPVTASYTIILIQNQADTSSKDWTKGSTRGLLIRSDAPFSKFEAVMVDGSQIASANYEASEGSTNILLKPEYLNTLKEGTHKITIKSTDGEASAEFRILKADNSGKSPKTGEQDLLAMWIILAMIAASACGISICVAKR